MNDHWNQHARQWGRVGPPLRPCLDDVASLEVLVRDACGDTKGRPASVVLLGVTPELATMRWPAMVELTAVDRSQAMIDAVWPGRELALPATVVRADWRELPLGDGTAELVVGDGCYTALDSPDGYERVTREVRRVLRPGGTFIHRFFVKPPHAEAPREVFTDLLAGRIQSFHVMKWRLAMALHGNLEAGVRLGDVWNAWKAGSVDETSLERRLGWSRATLSTIDAYRGVDTRYTFPTLGELRRHFAAGFAERACRVPSYELGDRCPTLVLCTRTRSDRSCS